MEVLVHLRRAAVSVLDTCATDAVIKVSGACTYLGNRIRSLTCPRA